MAVFPPIALTIAGTDPTGGAGIQADLKTFSAFRVYGASVMTALVAQNTKGVTAIHDVPTDFIRAQLDSVFDDLDVAAVKIGMLSQPQVIETVSRELKRRRVTNLVLDPVMVAASGDRLLAEDAVAALRDRLVPLARLITPNLPEAADLLGEAPAGNEEEMIAQGRRLLALGCGAVLVKGGHAEGEESVDFLVDAEGVTRFPARRIHTKNTHGTGCTLSSAITAGLALGRELKQAVAEAKIYISGAIAASDDLRIGQGHGPVHHYYAMWK